MRSRPITAPGHTLPLWAIALVVAVATAALGAVVLRPWGGVVTEQGHAAWTMVMQVGLTILVVMTWAAPRVSQLEHTFAARAIAIGIALPLVGSIWGRQIAPGLGLSTTVVAISNDVAGAMGGLCLVAMVTSLARRAAGRGAHDYDAMLDAAVVGAAVAIVVWELLVIDVGAGRLAAGTATATTVSITIGVAIFVRLALSSARRLAAVWLLGTTLVLAILAVTVHIVGIGVHVGPDPDPYAEVVALAAYGTVAAAVLHPSFRQLVSDRRDALPPAHGLARAMTLCFAVIVPSTVAMIRAVHALGGGGWSAALAVPPAVAGMVITLGVALRLAQLLRERERTNDMLRHRSLHDHLTGLPNRAYLLEHLEQQIAHVRAHTAPTDLGFGLMFLDLDGFKSINDTYGHHAGDVVLTDVANRLADTVRTDDFVGRMAGDEFVLVCGQPSDEPALHQLAERLRTAVEEPLPAEFGVVTPKVSIGIVSVDRETALTRDAVSTILRQADAQMYTAKAATATPTAAPAPREPRMSPLDPSV